MSNIAEIGFKVNTSELEKGERALNRLPAAAAGVDAANNKMARLAEAAGAETAAAATAAARAYDRQAQAALAAARAAQGVSREELKALTSAQKITAAKLKEAQAHEANVAKLNKEAAAIRRNNALELASNRPSTRVSGIVSGGRVQDAVPARDQMPNRFNTGNIAAQFQDIGVTAAMGMNPLQIALQQGTQLSAILQTMENPLKGIAIAFRSVFNAVSLLSIGIVAVVAAILQFVNWTKLAKSVLNALADALVTAAPYAAVLAVGLTLLYAPSIIAGLYTLSVAIAGVGWSALKTGAQMAAAWLIGLGPVGLVIAAVTGMTLLFMAFREDLKQMLGFDVLESIKSGVNTVLEFFSRMYDTIYYGFKTLVARMKQDSEAAAKYKALARGADPIQNPIDPNNVPDRVGAIGDKIAGAAGKAATGIRKFAAGLGADDDKKKDPWKELIKGAERTIATLKSEQDQLTLTAEAADKLKYQTDLLNEAQQKSIKLTPAMRDQIAGLASTMAAIAEKTRNMKEVLDFARDSTKGFISDLRSGLNEGKSLWQSFGSAVVNVLNKIIDKLLEASIDGLFGGPGLGGLSKGITGLLGAFGFGGTESAISASIAANPGIYAKGGAFQNGVQKFASGGIVSSATSFGMAGGKTGVMGEAGPEAIMPLHRGPDGSLGVRVSDMGSGAKDAQTNSGNTYIINAPGASKADLEAVKMTLLQVAGPGKIETRVKNAQSRGAL